MPFFLCRRISSRYLLTSSIFPLVPPERVKINREPQDFHAGQEGRIICESSSSNPAAEMSWWKNGIPVPGTRNSTKPGLHGGYLSSVVLALDLTEDMNGEVYMCEAKNTELGRSVHDATTLDVLCKCKYTDRPQTTYGLCKPAKRPSARTYDRSRWEHSTRKSPRQSECMIVYFS